MRNRSHPKRFRSWLPVVLLGMPPLARADTPSGVSFTKDVAPILVQKCLACHGLEKPKGRFRLDTFEALMKPGASASPSIVAGKPRESELFRLITSRDDDERMPQKDEPLALDQIGLIERWISQGARFDGTDARASIAVTVAAATAYPRAPEVYPRPVPVLALAFTPDGRHLVAGGYHEVTVWEAGAGTLVRRIGDLPQQIQSLSFADGRELAVGGGTPGVGGEVKLIDFASGAGIRSLAKTPEAVFAVAFHPSGDFIAAGGADGAIRIFDAFTGVRRHLIEQHADWVLSLAWSEDGNFLVSASRDKTARVFDAHSAQMLHGYPGHTEPVFAAAFSSDAKRVFSAGRDRRVHLWKSTESEKPESQVSGSEDDLFRVVRAGKWLVTGGADRKVRVYDAEKRDLLRTLEGHGDWIYGLAVHLPTRRVASSSFDGEVRVWSFDEGMLLKRFYAAPGYRR